ncbi:Cupredoxin [Phaeosphaeriaceae sp. PMI808]|nr:Cupredoxin [Phaeosphaeriaceae sp. PMI808]
MYFSKSIIVTALVGLVAAQSSSRIVASESRLARTSSAGGSLSTGTPSAGAGSPAGMINTHIVQVGGPNGSLAFYPASIQANPGDMVQFQFHPKNHSVAQSTFDNPCIPIQNIQPNKTDAFFSGFMPSNASFGATSNVLTYTIMVKDTRPVWFYCSQGRHCQSGMVGAINAPATGNRTMQSFVALAARATENLSPGQAAGSGTGNTPNGPGGNSPSGTTPSGNTPQSPSGSSPAQASSNVAPVLSSQSFFSLGAAAIAAFAML